MMCVVSMLTGFLFLLMIGHSLTLEDASCEIAYLSKEQILTDSSTTNLRFNNTVIEWTAEFNNEDQFIEIHLKQMEHIVEIETNGSNISYFSMIYSSDGEGWTIYPKLIRTSTTAHHLQPELNAKYLKIIPHAYTGNMSLRLQFMICADYNFGE